MKMLIVTFLSLCVIQVSLGSLEPAGYRPPGSSPYPSSKSYKSPSYHNSYQQNVNQPNAKGRNLYLPPSANSRISLPIPEPFAKSPPAASNSYLPPPPLPVPVSPIDGPSPLVPVPSLEYLPPLEPRQPVIPNVKTKQPFKIPISTNNEFRPISADYIPPTKIGQQQQQQQLHNSRVTTPLPLISVITLSPYELPIGNPEDLSSPDYNSQQLGATKDPAINYPHHEHHQEFAGTDFGKGRGGNYDVGIKGREGGGAVGGVGGQHAGIEQPPSSNYLPAVDRPSADSGYHYDDGAAGQIQAGEGKYGFEYSVKDGYGNDFAHKESKNGIIIKGVYTVLLPDGRKQIVHYEADENGFKPSISYEESNLFPSKSPSSHNSAISGGYDGNANSLNAHGHYN